MNKNEIKRLSAALFDMSIADVSDITSEHICDAVQSLALHAESVQEAYEDLEQKYKESQIEIDSLRVQVNVSKAKAASSGHACLDPVPPSVDVSVNPVMEHRVSRLEDDLVVFLRVGRLLSRFLCMD